MITNYRDIKNKFTIPYREIKYEKPIWGTACQDAENKTKFSRLLIPTEGIISPTKYEDTYEEKMKQIGRENSKNRKQYDYFIPFRKNSRTKLAWSKARFVRDCQLSRTENDAWIVFMLEMKENLNIHMFRMKELYERQQEITKECQCNDEKTLKLLNILANEQKEFINLITLMETHDNEFSSKIQDYTERSTIQS